MAEPRLIDPTVRAHDRVYRSLRARILVGEIAPGATLTLRGLAAEFGVSMTPAREAVQRLAAEGALTLSLSGRISTPVLSNERIEELASIRPDLDGNQIMRILDIGPGREIGQAYAFLLELRMDEGPQTPEQAEAALRAWWAARS